MKQGQLVVIDGPEGAGKTTQLRLLEDVLPHRYDLDFVFTREPGGTPFANHVRSLVLHDDASDAVGVELIQAYGAARFHHVRTLVLPAMLAGKTVVCDRFDAITFAYQVVAQQGGEGALAFYDLQRKTLERLFTNSGASIWTTIILDIPVDVTKERLALRGAMNHFDRRLPEFYERAREGFRQYKCRYPSRTHVLCGALTPALVHQDIIDVFDRVLGGPARRA